MSDLRVAVTGTRGIPGIMGGVETHCEELMPRLAARGADILLFRRSAYVRESEPLAEWRGVHLADVKSLKRKSLEAILHTACAIFAARRRGYRLVHIHAIGPGLLVPLAKLLGMRVVFTHHGFDYNRAKWGPVARAMLRLGERFAAKHADEVIVISQAIRRHLADRFGRSDTHLIPNGVVPGKRLPEPELREELSRHGLVPGGYVMAVCRFVPEKNLHHLVEAWERAACRNLKLVLVGDADFEDDYSRELKRRARLAGAVLPGFLRGKPLQALWNGTRAFFLPSSHEGLPVSLLEAMSHGVLSYASDIPGNRELALPSTAYFRVGDIDFMVDKLRAIDDGTIPALPIAFNLAPFDWERIADATLAVYRAARHGTPDAKCNGISAKSWHLSAKGP